MRKVSLFIFLTLLSAILWKATSPASGEEMNSIVFLADLPNPNDFSLFANGGWDGNWYVGYNTCWIQEIPAPPEGVYRKAFLGAKLGRMKNAPRQGKTPWEKRAIPGAVYIAVSSTPSWTGAQSYYLTSTDDIPLEPDSENAVEGVGESRWFWKEIPLKLVNFKGDNYIALWSPSEKLFSASSAPILAAGWGTKDVDTWVNHDIKGFPPTDPAKALSTPVTIFEPAIALKLVPSGAPDKVPEVKILRIENGKQTERRSAPKVVWSSVQGDSIEKAWVEISTVAGQWDRFGRSIWNAPFCFTLKMEDVPIGSDGKTWVRVVASDIYSNTGVSESVNLFDLRQ